LKRLNLGSGLDHDYAKRTTSELASTGENGRDYSIGLFQADHVSILSLGLKRRQAATLGALAHVHPEPQEKNLAFHDVSLDSSLRCVPRNDISKSKPF
jgi:hypothetical protein